MIVYSNYLDGNHNYAELKLKDDKTFKYIQVVGGGKLETVFKGKFQQGEQEMIFEIISGKEEGVHAEYGHYKEELKEIHLKDYDMTAILSENTGELEVILDGRKDVLQKRTSTAN